MWTQSMRFQMFPAVPIIWRLFLIIQTESTSVCTSGTGHNCFNCLYFQRRTGLLTVKGWAGFLSRISQDSRTEFFMAAFTRKLVAKTKVQK